METSWLLYDHPISLVLVARKIVLWIGAWLLPAPKKSSRKSTGTDICSWEGGAANQGGGMNLVNTDIDRFFYFYSVQFIPYNLNKVHGIWACNPGNPYYTGFSHNPLVSESKKKKSHTDEKFLEGHVPPWIIQTFCHTWILYYDYIFYMLQYRGIKHTASLQADLISIIHQVLHSWEQV